MLIDRKKFHKGDPKEIKKLLDLKNELSSLFPRYEIQVTFAFYLTFEGNYPDKSDRVLVYHQVDEKAKEVFIAAMRALDGS